MRTFLYDTSCGAPYSDDQEAADLIADLRKDCTSESCIEAGSRWSHIYGGMGTIMLLIMCSTCCVCIGAYKPIFRCIAGCAMNCLCCAHFGMWIATAVYRFRPYGKLCALSKVWTNYTSTDLLSTDYYDDSWTYEKDGSLILGLWVVQLLGCCCCCFAGVNMPKPARMG